MSKIDDYKRIKVMADSVEKNLICALGKDSPSNDKHALEIRFDGKTDGYNWGDALCRIHASYGYYGSSSGYRAMNVDVARYLVKAINAQMPILAQEAIKFAKQDAEKARKDAESEAQEVLKAVSE